MAIPILCAAGRGVFTGSWNPADVAQMAGRSVAWNGIGEPKVGDHRGECAGTEIFLQASL